MEITPPINKNNVTYPSLVPPSILKNNENDIKQNISKDIFYENTNYITERIKKKILVLNLDALGIETTFSKDLHEPLKVSHCDIYLDSFTTFRVKTGAGVGSGSKSGFLLKIDQFDIQSISNTPAFNNSFFIPNDQTTAGDPQAVRTHKGKKLNYICSINPQTLTKLSGRLTLLDGSTTVGGGDDFSAIIEFVIIERE
jgi:hypothetical protein